MSQAEFLYKMFHKPLILIDLLINFFFQIFLIFIKTVIKLVATAHQLELKVVVAVTLFRVASTNIMSTPLTTGLND